MTELRPNDKNLLPAEPDVDLIVIGAGFAGLYAIHRARQMGLRVQGFELADDVGGTWYMNRYPGARCDVESMLYSYSFDEDLQQDWTWTERFATQPEILAYARHVADRFDLRKSLCFSTRIVSAGFNEQNATWAVSTDSGHTLVSRFLVTAVGCLSTAAVPEVPGHDTFSGESYHTGQWPEKPPNFTGKRVAIIGTGSSGVQVIPEVAKEADSVVVLQRTATFCAPARNRPLTDEEVAGVKADYSHIRQAVRGTPSGTLTPPATATATEMSPAERKAALDARWEIGGPNILAAFADVMTDKTANDLLAAYIKERIRETVVDPDTADVLTSATYPVGAKRLCVGTDYFETFNRPNVELVDISEDPITSIVEDGIKTKARSFEVDVIVFATGYDAITGSLDRIDIRGCGGQSLKDAWQHGPQTYLGIAVNEFPNLFLITGPGSPSVLGNVLVAIEQHVEWIADLLGKVVRENLTRVEAEKDAQVEWTAHVHEVAAQTLYPHAKSWYTGKNIEGKPDGFIPYAGGYGVYRQQCTEVAMAGYPGFRIS